MVVIILFLDLDTIDNNVLQRPVARACRDGFNGTGNVHTGNDIAKCSMLWIQEMIVAEVDEELAPVCIPAGIGHGNAAFRDGPQD